MGGNSGIKEIKWLVSISLAFFVLILILLLAFATKFDFPPFIFNSEDLLLFAFVLILLLFVLSTVIYSIHISSKIRIKALELLEKGIFLDENERKGLIKVLEGPAPPIRGFTRAVIALTVLLVLGISLFAALFLNVSDSGQAIVTPILGALTGLAAAITGFYDGSRLTENQNNGE